MMKSILALCVLASANVYAAEWNTAIWAGLTHSASGSATVTVGSTTVGPIKSDGTAAFEMGVEYFRRTASPVNLTIILENTWMGNKDEPADFATSLLVGPRFETNTPINVWAEFGVGPSLTTLGKTSATSGGLTATFNSGHLFSLALSPRIGFDYKIDDKYFVGIQAAYFTSNFSIDGKYSGTLNANFTEDASKHFFTTAIRFGYSLGSDTPKSEAATQASTPIPPMPKEEPAAAAPQSEAPKGLDADELLKLKKLRDAGVLTEKEYQDRKAKLLK